METQKQQRDEKRQTNGKQMKRTKKNRVTTTTTTTIKKCSKQFLYGRRQSVSRVQHRKIKSFFFLSFDVSIYIQHKFTLYKHTAKVSECILKAHEQNESERLHCMITHHISPTTLYTAHTHKGREREKNKLNPQIRSKRLRSQTNATSVINM